MSLKEPTGEEGQRVKSVQVKLFERPRVLRGILHLRSWFRWVFCFPSYWLMLNYQCIIEKHSEQMQGYGLGRESADETAAYPPPSSRIPTRTHTLTPMPLLAHKGSPGTATVFRSAHTKYPIKKGFKFPPLSWTKINLNSIYSARIPTEQVIVHNRSARWQQLKGETLTQSGICFQRIVPGRLRPRL